MSRFRLAAVAAWRWTTSQLRRGLPWIALTAAACAAVGAVILLPPLFTPDLEDPQAQFEVRDRARLTVAAVVGASPFSLAGT